MSVKAEHRGTELRSADPRRVGAPFPVQMDNYYHQPAGERNGIQDIITLQ